MSSALFYVRKLKISWTHHFYNLKNVFNYEKNNNSANIRRVQFKCFS